MSTTLNYLNKAIGNNKLIFDERKKSWDFKVLAFIKKTHFWENIQKWNTKMHNKILKPFIKIPRQMFYISPIK
jgi:hypothetical protein